MNPKLKQAYELVIKDLKKQSKCRSYQIGCFDCWVGNLRRDLESFYEFEIETDQ